MGAMVDLGHRRHHSPRPSPTIKPKDIDNRLTAKQKLKTSERSLTQLVRFDSETLVVTSSISMMCRLSLSGMLIGVELRVCIHRSECVSICTVFWEKKKLKVKGMVN